MYIVLCIVVLYIVVLCILSMKETLNRQMQGFLWRYAPVRRTVSVQKSF